jgi:hypothetical protein
MAEELYNGAAVHEGFHDLADLRAFARKLIEHWDRWQMKPFHMKGEYDVGGPILWSFTNHVVNLMRTVLDLSEKDRGIIAVPLIRLIVENTMTGMWLYLEPSNTWAILTEGFQKRKAAINGVIEIEGEGFDKSDVAEIDQILESLDSATLPPFEQRCADIEGGKAIYVVYRVLSSYCHAGMALGDFYLGETEEYPGLERIPDARLPNHEAWLGAAVSMLIISMKLCDNIDYKGGLKSQLDRAAKRMGMSLNFVKAPKKEKKTPVRARKARAEVQGL